MRIYKINGEKAQDFIFMKWNKWARRWVSGGTRLNWVCSLLSSAGGSLSSRGPNTSLEECQEQRVFFFDCPPPPNGDVIGTQCLSSPLDYDDIHKNKMSRVFGCFLEPTSSLFNTPSSKLLTSLNHGHRIQYSVSSFNTETLDPTVALTQTHIGANSCYNML